MDAKPPPERNPYEPPRAEGLRPRPVGPILVIILRTFLGVVAVLVASLVAFVVTCFPTGLAIIAVSKREEGLGLAGLVGAASAFLTGWATFRWLRRRDRRPRPAGEDGPDGQR